jgi:hypothetical protein
VVNRLLQDLGQDLARAAALQRKHVAWNRQQAAAALARSTGSGQALPASAPRPRPAQPHPLAGR